jgi:hypothetical protein
VKILQTLGRHAGAQEGVFQYKRSSAGVFIDSQIGQAKLNPPTILISVQEWSAILKTIEANQQQTLRLTGTAPFAQPPNTSLYELLGTAVPNPSGGWNWNDSWKAYVCAILEHEGSIDLYHGILGPNVSAIICLAKDIP